MKKLTDEQIQALLDSELKPSGDMLSASEKQQMESYQSLFQKLNTEPEQGLPFNFVSKVSRQLQIKLKRRSDIRFNLLALFGIIAGLGMAYGILTLIDLNSGNQFLLAMLRYKWLLIFGSLILVGTLMFEQRVVEEN
ncbi:hypothetical protein AB6735_23170 [Mucilaginibacter sp. RCC_168]|jgi:hypothetical protein|uniref:hypothetical protein n=1 Tax=Mucilaginibacter sp. RCC_168 TaxID=3239221 RepID=UPI003525F851